MQVSWEFLPKEPERAKKLANALRIPTLIAQLLLNRGLEDPVRAYHFLFPKLSDLHNPFLLKDMDRAVSRIAQAIANGEKIVIYGDYDVDGLTSTALIYHFLHGLTPHIDCYIPNRIHEGYGLNIEAVKRIATKGFTLMITTDCGISNCEEIAFARDLGLDVIVVDHHKVPSNPPPAYAIINPKQNDCSFPFKELAGVGVAFNLIIALRRYLKGNGAWDGGEIPNLKAYLDLVALGTIADIVPLIDENRIFVRHGLEVLKQTERPGIKALKEISGLNHRLNCWDVAFRLSPRLNAAGRMGKAGLALRLLISEDKEEAKCLAGKLNELNQERQRIEERIWREANRMVKETGHCVLANPQWHPGVIGIVAGRLTEAFNQPTILISLWQGQGRGSGRSPNGFNLYQALQSCASYLSSYGGHELAVGLKIMPENLEKFIRQFEQLVNSCGELNAQRLYIDAEADFKEINLEFMRHLQLFEPYGLGNPEPTFCSKPLEVKQSIVNERHLKLLVSQGSVLFEATGPNSPYFHPLPKYIKLAFTPYQENWRQIQLIKLRIKDIMS